MTNLNLQYWQGRTVVVTGGNGFLGTKVVNRLRSLGAHVVAPRRREADLTKVGVAEQAGAKAAHHSIACHTHHWHAHP